MNPQTVIFLGPQGSGKGTQVQLLKAYLAEKDPKRQILHFEMGKSLRELAARPGYTPSLVHKALAQGSLIAYFISEALFSNFLVENMIGDDHLIIDGFPRQKDQIAALDSAMTFYARQRPVIICIDISDDEAVSRLMKRGRADDTEESVRKRLSWSRNEAIPSIEWFRTNPAYRVLNINGERPVEVIHQDILTQLNLVSS